jgi:hypothetical protein
VVPHDPDELRQLSTGRGGDRPLPADTEADLISWAYERFPGYFKNPRAAARTVAQRGLLIARGGRVRPGGRRGRGSSVPDLYVRARGRRSLSIEAKNYHVGDEGDRAQLVIDVVIQARQRAAALPRSARQHVVIDLRGQHVSRGIESEIRRALVEASRGVLRPRRIHFLR